MAKTTKAKTPKGPKGPKGPKKNPKTASTVPGASGAVGTDHNSRLTPDDERRLFLNHREIWNRHQAKQVALDEQRTKIVASLKADGFKVLHMEIADDLGKPKGEKKQHDKVQDVLKVARWTGHPMGAQMDLFNQPDRTPSVDRAFDQGKQASMEGTAKKPPYSPETEQYRSWMAGFDEDQERLHKGVGRGKAGTEAAQEPGSGGVRVERSEFKKQLQENAEKGAQIIKEGQGETPPPAPEPNAPGTEQKQ